MLLAKLSASFLILSLMPISFATVFAIRALESRINHHAFEYVKTHLKTAKYVVEGHKQKILNVIKLVANRPGLHLALEFGMLTKSRIYIENETKRSKLDFLILIDQKGNVIANSGLNHSRIKSQQWGQFFNMFPIDGGVSATELNYDFIPLLGLKQKNKEDSKTKSDHFDSHIISFVGVVPVANKNGKILGYLLGGEIIDTASPILARIEKLTGARASMYLHNNKVAEGYFGMEEIGLLEDRMNPRIKNAIYQQGAINYFTTRVSPWPHFSATLPLLNWSGNIIGALTLGLPQEPYLHTKRVVRNEFFYVALILAIVSMIVGLMLAKKLESGLNRAQQAAMQSEKLASIGTLASGVAHEINNPLAGIMSLTEVLEEENDPDLREKYLEKIKAATRRAAHIVTNLRSFSQSVRQEGMSPHDIEQILDETIELVGWGTNFDNIEVEKTFRHVPPVKVDRGQMQQVFINIITNAVQSMDGDGRLNISTRRNGSFAEISIEDNGPGIPQAIRDSIFDPFFTTKDQGEGTGLGLNIVYRIITQHGGSITLTSENGDGAQFTVSLPIHEDKNE